MFKSPIHLSGEHPWLDHDAVCPRSNPLRVEGMAPDAVSPQALKTGKVYKSIREHGARVSPPAAVGRSSEAAAGVCASGTQGAQAGAQRGGLGRGQEEVRASLLELLSEARTSSTPRRRWPQ